MTKNLTRALGRSVLELQEETSVVYVLERLTSLTQ